MDAQVERARIAAFSLTPYHRGIKYLTILKYIYPAFILARNTLPPVR
jgi:hypothetical protein